MPVVVSEEYKGKVCLLLRADREKSGYNDVLIGRLEDKNRNLLYFSGAYRLKTWDKIEKLGDIKNIKDYDFLPVTWLDKLYEIPEGNIIELSSRLSKDELELFESKISSFLADKAHAMKQIEFDRLEQLKP